MKRIQYENFKTQVAGPIRIPGLPGEPPREVMVLSLTDSDSGDVHEFAYPTGDAAKVGAAMQAKAARIEPAPASALASLKNHRGPGGKPRQ